MGGDPEIWPGRATVNRMSRALTLAVAARRTSTCSPGRKGALGRKLAPEPVEYAISLPGCAPLCEPTTEIDPSRPAGAPRKLI
jgi:hypothetical protein